MRDRIFNRLVVAALAYLLGMGLFGYGVAVGAWQWWPYQQLSDAWHFGKTWLKYGKPVPRNLYHAAPEHASRQRFEVYRPNEVAPGYYAFVGWDEGLQTYVAWLLDHRGKMLHQWNLDYDALDPHMTETMSRSPHPFAMLADASVIVGYDQGRVMARLDRCSKPLWIKKGNFHHSLNSAYDGGYWVWRSDGNSRGQDQYLHKFDAETGETLLDIDLVQKVVKPLGEQAFIFGIRPDYPFRRTRDDPAIQNAKDIFHPNDIDVLSPELAPKFPMFEAGDLLLSFRQRNLVMVLDGDDFRMKWYQNGPWVSQHDPDFLPDGTISVFSNNTALRRSEIINIDPETRAVSNRLYAGEVHFSTPLQGKHQSLPGESVLIIVPNEGRAVVANAEGNKILEFNNVVPTHPETNAWVGNGAWLPVDFFSEEPVCNDR